jgi:hypothetical protein
VSINCVDIQNASILPPRRKLEGNPPTPFRCPNTLTIIRNKFFFPPPLDDRNFLLGGRVNLFWNDPFKKAGQDGYDTI